MKTRKTIYISNLLLFVSAVLCPLVHVNAASSNRPLPSPAIHMYGFSDGGYQYQSEIWDQILSVATIIEGTTQNAAFVKQLQSQGKIFAYHVVNTFSDSTTAEEVANTWAIPFQNTLYGKLPDGFDAVCIDELHSYADGSANSIRTINAIKILRQRYPNKYIMAAGVWQLGLSGDTYYVGGTSYDNQLKAVRDDCDLFFLENYITESNIQIYIFDRMARNVNSRVPGLLSKTIFGLGIAQSTPFAYDNSPFINFNEYLDAQFHTIRNDSLMKTMPGIGFWVFYRARPETLLHCAELCKHYYYENKTNYYGQGQYNNILLQDPGFDAGNTVAWRISNISDIINYASLSDTIPAQHYSLASHGTNCLKTTRGSIASRIRQIVSVEPGCWYRLSGYVTSNSSTFKATLGAFDHRGEAYFQTSKNFTFSSTSDVNTKWKRIAIRFQVPQDTHKLVIYFSDEPSETGTILFWDFFEFEKDYINQSIPSIIW